jgi:hypothetical protein
MLATNAAVLRALEAALLTPAAVAAIVDETLAALRPVEDSAVPRAAALRADLAVVEGEITRLGEAIARAPDLGSLLDTLPAKEQRRAALQAEQAALDGLGRVRTLDPAALMPTIVAKLGDWSGLMGRRLGEARTILRHLLVGRLTFTQRDDGMVEFVGAASIGPLVAGTALASVGKPRVSPRGLGQRGRRSFAA